MTRRASTSLRDYMNICQDAVSDVDGQTQSRYNRSIAAVLDSIPRLPDLQDQVTALLIAVDSLKQIASASAAGANLGLQLAKDHQPASVLRIGSVQVHAKHPKVSKALEVIELRFAEPQLKLRDISSEADLSPAYLDRLFKVATGVGVSSHLRDLRIRRARRLLLESENSIKAIAFTVGFSQVATFDRAFKRSEGCSPTEWRSKRLGSGKLFGDHVGVRLRTK